MYEDNFTNLRVSHIFTSPECIKVLKIDLKPYNILRKRSCLDRTFKPNIK